MSATIRRRGPDADGMMLAAALGLLNVFAVCGVVLLVAHERVGHAVAAVVGLVVLDVVMVWLLILRNRPLTIDDAARHLAGPHELTRSTTKGVTRIKNELGHAELATPGLYIGKSVRGGRDLWASWEEMYVEISGPRTGKTTARAIPNIVAAPGPVLATSCKRDIVDATRGVRDEMGKTWVFDPQNVSGARPSFYWSPLAMVGGDLKDAMTIAGLFMWTQRVDRPGHRSDGYFEPAAQQLIAMFLLAADLGKFPITEVLKWLLRPDDDTPGQVLLETGHDVAYSSYEAIRLLPKEQRSGIYGTAVENMYWLGAPDIIPWITPGEDREEFPFVHFARQSTDTMYILSRSDDRTAAPAAACLTAACAVVGATGATKSPGGRLRKPLFVLLDEATNVAQLQIWPNRFSHFGSRGVVVMLLLQSWAQGANLWGDAGMAKLWGAASVRVFGAGGSERGALNDMSKLSGFFEASTMSASRPLLHMFDSVTRGSRPDPVLRSGDVSRMPRDRMIVQISGQRPVVARSIPWTEGPYADAIRASLDKYAL